MTPIRYVLGFMFGPSHGMDRSNPFEYVALIRKAKPAWQRGLLNGIGGKIEPGETPIKAMLREWKEETGCTPAGGSIWNCFAEMAGRDFVVTCYSCLGWRTGDGQHVVHAASPGRCQDEPVLDIPVCSLPDRLDILPNLRWLIPLALDHLATNPRRPTHAAILYQ